MLVSFLHGLNVNDVGTFIYCFPHIGTYSKCFEVLIFMRFHSQLNHICVDEFFRVYTLGQFQCGTLQTEPICETIRHPRVTASGISYNQRRSIGNGRISQIQFRDLKEAFDIRHGNKVVVLLGCC